MYELIIIGGGPAGITAAIYAARKEIKTLLISKDFIGQTGLAGEIENWPGEKNILGPQLMEKFQDHLNDYDLEILEEKVLTVEKKDSFLVKTENQELQSKTIIVASGRKPRSLNIPGEKKFVGKGISYCVTCDAAFFKNKTVVVIGGGNAGFEAAIELVNQAKEVYLLENSSTFKADKILQKKAEEKKIKLLTNVSIEEVRGDIFVKEIKYSGKTLKTDGVFIQIGSDPITAFLKNNLVEFNEKKEIEIDFYNNQTKTPGLFAAGDVTNIKDKQIVIAAGEGTKALLSCYDFLQKN